MGEGFGFLRARENLLALSASNSKMKMVDLTLLTIGQIACMNSPHQVLLK
jgi:hypothetical protein